MKENLNIKEYGRRRSGKPCEKLIFLLSPLKLKPLATLMDRSSMKNSNNSTKKLKIVIEKGNRLINPHRYKSLIKLCKIYPCLSKHSYS